MHKIDRVVGWIGSSAFMLCAVPQAAQSIIDGHSDGMNQLFLWLWILGELCMTWYVWRSRGFDAPLHLNYLINFICLVVITWYRY